ncbi:MAG: putative Fe-S cluster assembly protein SufT [Gammaproteobacteria bacterium]|nr:putative Fe-S cluster assembly protein SufT [Gammaproteobacteria bacterium]|tara:strand:+ start:1381 stop:1935 length:555 start_codon:yes stop_codon:yes gene_type:complete
MIAFAELEKGSELSVLQNVTGRQVPQGSLLTLGVGEIVTVTQALGDTVTLDIGSRLVRIETEDLEKLGVKAPEQAVSDLSVSLERQVWEVLKQSYDPEIPVNIVELGLIYDLRVSTLVDGRTHIRVDMTLTAPGCGMGPVMARDIKDKIEALGGVDQADIQMVFDPPWDATRMTEEARLEAGLF